ncbi:MAG: caspase family protein [Nitrospinae bacterium]|nr:caspase family protein [Nitrospinota bacterium]
MKIILLFFLTHLSSTLFAISPLAWAENRDLPLHAGNVGKRVALVIGNADYQGMPKLANPTHDAEDIAATLRGFGFEAMATSTATVRKAAPMPVAFAAESEPVIWLFEFLIIFGFLHSLAEKF